MRRYADVVLNSQGVPQTTATVTVTKAATPAGSGALATIYSDDGITPIANPVSTDSNGRFAFYVADGRYDLKAQLNSGANYIVADQDISSLTEAAQIDQNTIIVDGKQYPLTDAGIQSAINKAASVGSGSTVYMPAGTYICGPNLPIVISNRVNLIGSGWSTFLQINSNVGATTDVILVQPTSGTLSGIRIQDFQILPQSGHPARHGIQLDGTNGLIDEIIIDHVLVLSGLGSSALNAIGPGNGGFGPAGTPALSTIQNCSFVGGSASPAGSITLSNCGDTVRILNNRLSGSGAGIDISNYQVGSALTIIKGNNITNDGGSIHIGSNAVAPQITDNEFETNSTFTGSHGALVDFDGTDDIGAGGTVAIQGGCIKHNSFQVVNGITSDCIRLNNANLVYVGEGNRFGHGLTTSHDITLTANSTNNIVGSNLWMGTLNAGGLAYTAMVNDLGTNNSFLGAGAFVGFPGPTLAPNGIIYGVQDSSSTPYQLAQSSNAGGTLFFGYHNNRLAEGANGASYVYDGSASSNRAAAFSGTPSAAITAAVGMTTGYLAAGATAPTITGTGAAATITTQAGGKWNGTFKCAGTTGASTITITPGITAINGWNCVAQDMTTRANLIQQTSNTNTSVTLTATSITQNDIIAFTLFAY